jgi:2-hydroxychromene-2-carboxylate isomerase
MEQASEEEAKALIEEGSALRKKLRHYSGAMFFYEGEWYWGIDRLPHLEHRLAHLGARRPFAKTDSAVECIVAAPYHIDRFKSGIKFKLEYFPSLRSPYSFLSIDETLELEERYPVEIIHRPVMPMVMRGMKVPPMKGFYIFMDTKREADVREMGFGKVIDPVGPPVLRGFSLFPYARDKGKGGEYLRSFLHAAFAEGVDVYSKKGLFHVVSRAGLGWTEAKQFLDNEDWHDELEENLRVMFAAGCWGVPSYRLLGDDRHEDFAAWGNDRIWLIREEMTRRLRSES